MPYKANEPHRHKIPKGRFRVDNWATYDAALRRSGDLGGVGTPEAIAARTLPPRADAAGAPVIPTAPEGFLTGFQFLRNENQAGAVSMQEFHPVRIA